MLGLGPALSRMSALGMARKFNNLLVTKFQDLLEVLANLHQRRFLWSTFPTTGSLGPETDSIEGLADINNDTHDLLILIGLQGLADGSKHNVKPEIIDRNTTLILELICPFTTVLVLSVFPFRANTGLEEVVIGFQTEFGCFGYVILQKRGISRRCKRQAEAGETCVNPPELLNRIECDNLLEQIIPIVFSLE